MNAYQNNQIYKIKPYKIEWVLGFRYLESIISMHSMFVIYRSVRLFSSENFNHFHIYIHTLQVCLVNVHKIEWNGTNRKKKVFPKWAWWNYNGCHKLIHMQPEKAQYFHTCALERWTFPFLPYDDHTFFWVYKIDIQMRNKLPVISSWIKYYV